jgi:hypothetical protein
MATYTSTTYIVIEPDDNPDNQSVSQTRGVLPLVSQALMQPEENDGCSFANTGTSAADPRRRRGSPSPAKLVLPARCPPAAQFLSSAILNGNMTRVQDLLPRQTANLGFGLLQAACAGQRDVLELLLDTIAQTTPGLPQLASSYDALGRSPLHFAAANGDYGAAQLLIARGADVNVSIHSAVTVGDGTIHEALMHAQAGIPARAPSFAAPCCG